MIIPRSSLRSSLDPLNYPAHSGYLLIFVLSETYPSAMEKSTRPLTEFPGSKVASDLVLRQENLATDFKNSKPVSDRHTVFPGGKGLQKLFTARDTEFPIVSQSKEAFRTVPTIRLKINPAGSSPSRPTPQEKITLIQQQRSLSPEIKSPWDFYTALRPLQRGGEITAAYTRTAPTKMVAVKELSSDHFKNYRSCQHENLLSIIKIFRFKGHFFVVTDYTVTTLQHIIAIPLPLLELHVSATCHQGSPQSSIRAFLMTPFRSIKECNIFLDLGSRTKRLMDPKSYFSPMVQ